MLGTCNFWICVLAVRWIRQQAARSRHQQSNNRMSWQAYCRMSRLCWSWTTHRGLLRRIEQEMVDKGDAIKLKASGNQEEIVQEPDASLRGVELTGRHTQEGRIWARSSAESKNFLAGCIAVNKLLCDTPSVDLSQDRTAPSGKFPEDELKAGRARELQNMLNFDALVEELPPGKYAHGLGRRVAKWQSEIATLCASVQGRGFQRWFVCRNARHVFHQAFVGKGCKLQGFRSPRYWHQCSIYGRSNRWGKLCEVSRVQNFGDSRQQWMERGKHQSTGKSTRTLPHRTSAMCVELPLGCQVGERHPRDCGCRLSWRPEDKVLDVWRSIGNLPVLHFVSFVGDTSNSVTDRLSQRPRQSRKVALKRCTWNTCWNIRLHGRSRLQFGQIAAAPRPSCKHLDPGAG